MLLIRSLVLGPFQTNCHLLQNQDTKETVVVDPGDEPRRLLGVLKQMEAKVLAIWNTHGHIDHINANAPVQEETGAPITIHALEADWLQDATKNLAAFGGIIHRPSRADQHWKNGDSVQALGRQWTVHHVPGHSPGQCALACAQENLLIAGDLLFAGSIGRTDFPGSDPGAMGNSLRGLFNEWGRDEWRVLSGHGPDTTIGQERRQNPFVELALQGKM